MYGITDGPDVPDGEAASAFCCLSKHANVTCSWLPKPNRRSYRRSYRRTYRRVAGYQISSLSYQWASICVRIHKRWDSVVSQLPRRELGETRSRASNWAEFSDFPKHLAYFYIIPLWAQESWLMVIDFAARPRWVVWVTPVMELLHTSMPA